MKGFGGYQKVRARRAARLVLAGLAAALLPVVAAPDAANAVPPNFATNVVLSGMDHPTTVEFASDGRVFVAEKNGRVLVFDGLGDTTPVVAADLRAEVHNFWDRGFLGMALHPDFPTTPYLYALYTYNAPIGGTAPVWPSPDGTNDQCPNPPGATGDGCVVSGRLTRLEISGNTTVGQTVLVEDWCQQYPSHSIGGLEFGADGALYATGGDGASFNFEDWGQDGNPLNPCGDPPGGVGGTQTKPTAEGGALRSQDLRTPADPVSLDGTVIRIDPMTGAGLPDNPLAASADPNARRIVGSGLRNPFRFTIRPGTDEVWIGDVGWGTYEEVNRLADPTDAGVDNFAWPCYEGNDVRYTGHNICTALTNQGPGARVAPHFPFRHGQIVTPDDTCRTGSGSSVAGLSFYEGGAYPDSYDGALFFADYSRRCIYSMLAGGNGVPDPATRQMFHGNVGVIDLEVGPGGDLYFVDYDAGTVNRISYTAANQVPTAVVAASPTSGAAPLTVNLDGAGSFDPDGQALTYAWDLDGDGQFDDASTAQTTRVYPAGGNYRPKLRVTDTAGAFDDEEVLITVGSAPPTATITSPASSLRWRVGDTVAFSGTATDPEDGTLPASAYRWDLIINHCGTEGCHQHVVETFTGVTSGSFVAPDHEYPSNLELRLRVTDSSLLTDNEAVVIEPRTVDLTFATQPPGLTVGVGSTTAATPFTRTVIAGSTNSVTTTSPQSSGGTSYSFTSWSDGGAQSHNIVAPDAAATYTATFTGGTPPPTGLIGAWGFGEASGAQTTDSSGRGHTGTISGATRTTSGRYGPALTFDGTNDWVTVADTAALDLTTGMTLEAWVRPTTSSGWRTAILKERPGSMSYALYNSGELNRPEGYVVTSGGEGFVQGSGPLPTNTWSHLAVTYDGANLRYYLNGTLVSTRARTTAIVTSTGALRFGGNGVWGEYFAGTLDEIRIYNRALSAAEVQTDLNTPIAPDLQPPSTPTGLQATGGVSSVNLSWTASTDNVGVAGYDVHRAASAGFTPGPANRIATVTGTSYVNNGLTPGTYFYCVIAVDGAGNASGPSAQVSAAVTGDTIPPTVAISAPANGATVSETISVTANATDNGSVAGVQFRVDGVAVGGEDTTSPYSVSWNTRSVVNGPHQLTAVARDGAGNVTTSSVVAVTVSNAAVPPALVGAWGFSEGTGPTTADASGRGQTGTINGATWTAAGRYGAGITFDGTNDLVTVADTAALDVTGAMTLEAWVRPTTAGGWRTVILKERPGSLAYAMYGSGERGRPEGYMVHSGGDRAVEGPTALPTNTWSHVAVTYDGSAFRLYVNGALVATTTGTGTITTSTGALRIGGNTVWGEYFAGTLDEIRIYNRALSAAEIQTDLATPI